MSGYRQKPCRLDGCERRSNNDGLCRPHYSRMLKYGDPLATPVEDRTPIPSECTVDGCTRRVRSRGLCASHQRKGTDWTPAKVVHPRKDAPDPEAENDRRLRHYSRRDGECLLWTSTRIYSGYGMAWDSTVEKQVLAHRLAYETWVGPIPEGLDIDHTCKVRNCIEPAHLRPLTQKENRGKGGGPMHHKWKHGRYASSPW